MKSHTLALSAVLIATLAVATPLEQFGVTINTPNTQLLERGLATRTKLTDVLVRKDAEDVSLKADKEDSSSNDEVASQSTTLERRLVDNFLYFLGDTVGVVERGAEKIIGSEYAPHILMKHESSPHASHRCPQRMVVDLVHAGLQLPQRLPTWLQLRARLPDSSSLPKHLPERASKPRTPKR